MCCRRTGVKSVCVAYTSHLVLYNKCYYSNEVAQLYSLEYYVVVILVGFFTIQTRQLSKAVPQGATKKLFSGVATYILKLIYNYRKNILSKLLHIYKNDILCKLIMKLKNIEILKNIWTHSLLKKAYNIACAEIYLIMF